MSDDERAALEAAEEVVQTEAEQAEASEATESTEGQDQTQPAEADKKAEEQVSESKARRERRKAHKERLERERTEALAEADEAKARLAKIEAAATSSRPPKENDFDDYNQYLVAMGAYQARAMLNEDAKGEVTEKATQADARLQRLEAEREREAAQIWAEQRAEANTRYTDFEAVVSSIPISQATADLVVTSDVGADVAYFLGSNPQLANAIAQMNPVDAAREFGRIEASIKPPKPRTQSNAPDPVGTVRPKASATTDPAKMSVDEYRAWRASGGTF